MNWIFIVHIFTSFFMCGLCWFVQIVHYPLFLAIRTEDFPVYEQKNFVTAYVTVPTMVVELLTGLYLLYQHQELLYYLNVALLVIIGLSTAIFQVPMHLKLMKEADVPLIHKLIKTNWIRTIAWTLRAIILFQLMNLAMA